jgi:hypothetical protein
LEIEWKILWPLDVICWIWTVNWTDYILWYSGILEHNSDRLKPVKKSETNDNFEPNDRFKPDDYMWVWLRINNWPWTFSDFCTDKELLQKK